MDKETKAQFNKVTKRFDKVDKKFAQVDKRFVQVDKRFEQVDKRFEQVDKRFEQVDKRFEQVDKRFDRMDERFEELLVTVKQGFDEIGEKIDAQKTEMSFFRAKMELELENLRQEVRELSLRVDALEKTVENVKIRTKQDDDMLIQDFLRVKKHFSVIEKEFRKHGIRIPAFS